MKTYNLILGIICLLCITLLGCEEDDYPKAIPAKVKTGEVDNITGSSAIAYGSILDEGSPLSWKGIVWDTLPNPVIKKNGALGEGSNESFKVSMEGLKGGTKYYVRAFATNLAGIQFGAEKTFTTKQVPLVKTMESEDVEFIGGTSAEFGGEIRNDFGVGIVERGLCWGEEENPNIEEDSKLAIEGESDTFKGLIEGLKPSTVYHVRAYAIASNGEVGYGENENFETLIMDYDGNIYTSVEIAGLTWMVENFESTHFTDGTDLPHTFHVDDVNKEYGAHYAWNDIVKENFAPEGWHVATNAEWITLVDFVENDGLRLKEEGTEHWNTDNGTNETGFTALGGGFAFSGPMKGYAAWWTSDENSDINGLRWYLLDDGGMGFAENDKNLVFNVRLVKDY
nr:fibrobacter succinogenes major paralogous domain-containing protein [uncultured Allomuricauda sp.]